MPSPVFAETGTVTVSPPQASGVRPCSARSPITLSMVALGTSILFIATTMGTPAALECSIASRVWGMTPSSAATTSTTTSVTRAPRARISVKASWPGVSIKVILFPPLSTW
jgi:hypothetical protein